MRSWGKVLVLAALVAALSAPVPAGAAAAAPRDITKFACPADQQSPFTDVPGNTHEVGIECLFLLGIVNGTSASTFSPQNGITRGELATILARTLALLGVPLDITDAGFTDLGDNIHIDAINALANLGVLTGKTATTFDPNGPATRAQTASVTARTIPAGLPPNPEDAFIDDEEDVAHENAINQLAALGIISGVDASNFAPNLPLNRGPAASIEARTLDFMVEIGLVGPPFGFDFVTAALTPENVVPGPGEAGAFGGVQVVGGNLPGLLCVLWDIDGPLTSAPTSAHVHAGAAGATGPVVLTLPTPVVESNGRVFFVGCITGVSDDAINAVLDDPDGHYVDIETTGEPDGAVRGQLTRPTNSLFTLLAASEVEPGPGEPGVGGEAAVQLFEDGSTVCVGVLYEGDDDPASVAIHQAAPGASGPVVVELPPFDVDFPVADGCVGNVDPAVVEDIATNPASYYVQVNTTGSPDGAARGQLAFTNFVVAGLDGASEVPGPGDPDGIGGAFIELIDDGRLCFVLGAQQVDRVVAAHIHLAPSGVPGPIVVPLTPPVFGNVADCVDVDPALVAEIVANPNVYYVNVHTQAFPDGAIRGQLIGPEP